jgi:hypothetical protein
MICWFGNNSNTLDMNDSFIYFMSSLSLRVDENNFRESVDLYIARNRDIYENNFRRAIAFYTCRSGCIIDSRNKKNWAITSNLYFDPKKEQICIVK